MKTVRLYLERIVLQDEQHQDVRTIDVYEAGWRDNGGDGHNDTFENWVYVNHMNDYISREDVRALLDEHGGMYFEFTDSDPAKQPIEMPANI